MLFSLKLCSNCLRRGLELRFLCVASAAHFLFLGGQKTMKRLLALILVLSMILYALASCGGNSSNNDDEETTKKNTYKFDDEE